MSKITPLINGYQSAETQLNRCFTYEDITDMWSSKMGRSKGHPSDNWLKILLEQIDLVEDAVECNSPNMDLEVALLAFAKDKYKKALRG